MLRLVAAVALVAACRDHDAGRHEPASAVSVVPRLPISQDGQTELVMLGKRIELHRDRPVEEIELLLERAAITGTLEDYTDALARSEALVAATPADPIAWTMRVQVLARIHRFDQARALLDKVDPATRAELETSIDEGSGHADALPRRTQAAKDNPSAANLTVLAVALAQAGRFDDARALIPQAAANLRDNTPEILTWLLFQWGRVYELEGKLGPARELFAAARKRMPGSVEATSHLAGALIATGDRAGARRLVDEALAQNRHPSLLALDPAYRDEARAAWERYVAALPEAFSDHAARFYLDVDPKRAHELAVANLNNRPTPEAAALAVEAALADHDPFGACALAQFLATAPLRAQKFVAWRALSACGRDTEARRLASELGI